VTAAPDNLATLGEARAWLNDAVSGAGARCPCCDQWAKVYRRTITSSMARDLVEFARRTAAGEWFRIPEVLGYQGGDAAKLRHWALIEPGDPDPDTGNGGPLRTFRVTHLGRAWVGGKTVVARHALLYDGECLGLSSTEGYVAIRDVLGDRFDLKALLAREAGDEAGEVL
jgi:hypothetical protein